MAYVKPKLTLKEAEALWSVIQFGLSGIEEVEETNGRHKDRAAIDRAVGKFSDSLRKELHK